MILFFDTEVNKHSKIIDIGAINDRKEYFHSGDIKEFYKFAKKADFYVGHNIVDHDLIYIRMTECKKLFNKNNIIDTLYLSTLLFPEKPYHSLTKNDKLETDSINNPLNDSKSAMTLFYDLLDSFNSLDRDMQEILYGLLNENEGFSGFFRFIEFKRKVKNLEDLILYKFRDKICKHAPIRRLMYYQPIELAYALSIINTNNIESLLPPWVLKRFSYVEEILILLRSTHCHTNCDYCNKHLNPLYSLKRFFDYDKFREFDGVPLQQNAVEAALRGESFIAIFPTGGGKSLTFQLPALIQREATRGLTVVISPLQSLMKDQIDNLEQKGITSAVTINGLLNPIERSKAIERVRDGSACILYIAPESLRSKTIEKLLIDRNLVRFVIDEAHCFSTWGQDFRVDYLYIGEFIKHIQREKALKRPIPVSCFTATAKPNVIEDIKAYFKHKLDFDMKVYKTPISRKNLSYKVYNVAKEEKYALLRNLIEQEDTPTIVYAITQKMVEDIYNRLKNDKYQVAYFHGGLDRDIKITQQNMFMSGEAKIMVATNAFGMGVDKSDIGCIIHYQISDSLENYTQEAGRAARDENINGNCYILYNDDDLNLHFDLLNQNKLNLKEVQSIWKAIKELTKVRDSVSQSALEIAKLAGWDESVKDIETKVKSAIAALEDAGYVKRGLNSPRVFANSILVHNMMEAEQKISSSNLITDEKDRMYAKLIIKRLISSRQINKAQNDDAESRIDYLSDSLGIEKKDIIKIIQLLREEKILSDDQDLSVHFKEGEKKGFSLNTHKKYIKLLNLLISTFEKEPKLFNIKLLNEEGITNDINNTIKEVRIAINYLEIARLISVKKEGRDVIKVNLEKEKDQALEEVKKLELIGSEIIEYLFSKLESEPKTTGGITVVFSILELKKVYENSLGMLTTHIPQKDIENTLYFLQKINALRIEGGFMVVYSPLNVERIIKDNHKVFTQTDYSNLQNFYERKKEQIHIVAEYALKMIENYQSAIRFADDYFQMEYKSFLNKYFDGERKKEIDKTITPTKFKELFGTLTKEQRDVILSKNKRIAVAAGPGSGKTKLLVHKLASIIYMEDIKKEHLLMLTFSRAAAIDFRLRLKELIGTVADYIDIMTFHSFAFDLLGIYGDLDKVDSVIERATELIKQGKADDFKITRSVLVIDEAQDMNEEEYELVQALIEYNDNIRVIAVGDDDQNIFEFRGSSSHYFRQIAKEEDAFYQLSINFRSKGNIVDFSNKFVKLLKNRLKTSNIVAHNQQNGFIKVTKHTENNFIVPIVEEVKTSEFIGSTCIITRTNEDAVLINGLLNKYGISSQLIQSLDDFRLINLYEIREFYNLIREVENISIISDTVWIDSINKIKQKFNNSSNLQLVIKTLDKYKKSVGSQNYVSDLWNFLIESYISDFTLESTVFVSTFHKAKGKEFDNVIILYNKDHYLNEEELRTIYVGLTRAKSTLSIHTNSNIFDYINVDNLIKVIDDSEEIQPDRITIYINHSGVRLGYFEFVDKNVRKCIPGDELVLKDDDYVYCHDKRVLQLSKTSREELDKYRDMGYVLSSIKIKHMVYWYDKEKEKQSLIILPEITLDYRGNSTNS